MNSEDGAAQLGQQKKAKGGFLMLAILIIITIVLLSSTFYFYDLKSGEETTVLELTLKVSDGELDTINNRYDSKTQTYLPYINNISQDSVLKQENINAIESIGDTPLILPGIVVRALDLNEGVFISYWTSVEYDDPGYYNLTLHFKEMPKPGDEIIIKIWIEDDDNDTDPLFPFLANDLANSSIIYTWI